LLRSSWKVAHFSRQARRACSSPASTWQCASLSAFTAPHATRSGALFASALTVSSFINALSSLRPASAATYFLQSDSDATGFDLSPWGVVTGTGAAAGGVVVVGEPPACACPGGA